MENLLEISLSSITYLKKLYIGKMKDMNFLQQKILATQTKLEF